MTGRRATDPGRDPGEYALGLLTGEELAAARARAASDANFAREVARWRGRLAPMLDELEAVAAPDALWSRIERSIAATDGGNVIMLRRRVALWRGLAGAMTALAAALALLLLVRPDTMSAPTPAASAPMVAMLGDQKETKLVASWDPAARQLVLAVAGSMPSDAAHSHELWVIPAGGTPRSLGTMPDTKQMHMRLADTIAQLMREGATIAISLEPRGGSPSGAPTGPVVASGALAAA